MLKKAHTLLKSVSLDVHLSGESVFQASGCLLMVLKKVRPEMVLPFRQRCHSPIPDQHEIQCPETLIKAPSGTVEARTEALNRDVGDKGMGGVRLMAGEVMPIQ